MWSTLPSCHIHYTCSGGSLVYVWKQQVLGKSLPHQVIHHRHFREGLSKKINLGEPQFLFFADNHEGIDVLYVIECGQK